jgi:xylan 1,4-beta-xylosidase
MNYLQTLALASFSLAAFGEVTYQNPVIPGDYPDPSVIRVGRDYYATATTSEWAPLFPILHSRDLVNWKMEGAVFHQRPDWAVGNFWAPEISHFGKTYYVYYVARKRGGPLSIAVATASKPEGPYTDHGPMIGQADGSIDPVPVEDENGKRYLIWKEDGNSRNQPTPLWIQELSADGTKLMGEMRELLRNDSPWEGRVVEGPSVIRHNGYYYLFYAGNACCGRNCHYGVGVARAKHLLGPWEKNPQNPLVIDNEIWKCPGHGTVVEDRKGAFYLMYHAYHVDSFVYVGRQAVLDKIDFEMKDPNAWPVINGGKGIAFEAASPSRNSAKHQQFDFADEFNSAELNPEWQWPQSSEPRYALSHEHKGELVLRPDLARSADRLGGVLALKTTAGQYTAETVLRRDAWVAGTLAGLSAFGDLENALGLAFDGEHLQLWRRAKKKDEVILTQNVPAGDELYLKLAARDGHKITFLVSLDGSNWMQVAPEAPLEGDYLPPWDRGVRVALTVGGGENAQAKFEWMRMHAIPPRLRP